jgi:hypothetical protein
MELFDLLQPLSYYDLLQFFSLANWPLDLMLYDEVALAL